MKKCIWTSFLAMLLLTLSACNGLGVTKPSEADPNATSQKIYIEYQRYNPISFAGYEEYFSFFEDIRENGVSDDFERKNGPEMTEFVTQVASGELPLLIPFVGEEPLELADLADGSICIFAEGNFGYHPKVWFYSKLEDQYIMVRVGYLPEEYREMADSLTCAQLIDKLSPKFSQREHIHERRIENTDRIALYSVSDTERVNLWYLDNGSIVNPEIPKELMNDEWLASLHFSAVELEELE